MFKESKLNKTQEKWLDLIKQGTICPYFQPILSIENKSVYGYEALGRLILSDGTVHSLGEFFLNNQFDAMSENSNYFQFKKFQGSIDSKLKKQAYLQFANDPNPNSKLFINISPDMMFAYTESAKSNKSLPSSIRNVKEFGISPERIVIEITEDYVHKKLESLKPLIYMYKDFGFMIAIDDLGSKSSNLDRIGVFCPDIIKVDMKMLKMSLVDRSYKEILYTLSHLGESLGISLLFEGVETIEEIHQAMSFGSRYIQGFLFDEAMNVLPKKTKYTEQLNQLVYSFYSKKSEEIKQRVYRESRVEMLIQKIGENIEFKDDGNILSHFEIFNVDESIYRFFITDLQGNQTSPNYIRKQNSEIEIQIHTKNNNWSWRPYFLNHLYESSRSGNSWVISQPYHDIAESLLLRTFSKTFNERFILFIDVYYEE